MIRFNSVEIPHTYFDNDALLLDIQSQYSIKDFAEKLKRHELNNNEFTIIAYENTNDIQNGKYYTTLAEYNTNDDGPSFSHLFDGEVEEGLNDISSEGRNPLFAAYEASQFGNYTAGCKEKNDFSLDETNENYEENYKILYDNIMDALGIMPTLTYLNEDISITDLIKASEDGEHLYWPFEYIGKTNKIPSLDDIKLYQSLNPYEKRLFNESQLNPAYKLSVTKDLKELNRNAILSKELLTKMQDSFVTKEYLIGKYYAPDELKNSSDYLKADELFKAANRGRSPRVLPEMIKAWREYYDIDKLLDEQIKEIVDTFTLSSLSQVAKYNNPALFILANKIHFNEIPKDHIEVFASYLTVTDVKKLENKGFIEWYKNNHDLGANSLSSTIEAVDSIEHFDIGKTAQQLIYEKSQKKGLEEAKIIKDRYGIDFEENIVAIPGRSIRATDGKNVMYMLKPEDARNITVGYDTHCCQHLGGAGGTCMLDAISNPSSAITVIEDIKTQKIKAQAWTRYDAIKDTLVFDNMEFADDREVQSFSPLITAWSFAMPEKHIHVGTGYNQGMINWGKPVGRANANGGYVHFENEGSTIGHSTLYSDYHSTNARCIKLKGEVLLNSNISNITISRGQENEHEYDYLINPIVLCIIKNLNVHLSTEQKKELYTKISANEAFPDEYVRILLDKNSELLSNVENISLDMQKYILENKPDDLKYIKHIDPTIALETLKKMPNKIKDMEDVTYEQAEAVLGINGLLLEFIVNKPSWENFSKEQKDLLLSEAINQNPYSIKRIKDPDSKWVQMAIYKKKELLISYPNVNEYIWVAMLKKYPHMIKYAINPTYKMQATAIRTNPYALNDIKNPNKEIVREAISMCGSLILNPKYKTYIDTNTKRAAIKNNPVLANKLDTNDINDNLSRNVVKKFENNMDDFTFDENMDLSFDLA